MHEVHVGEAVGESKEIEGTPRPSPTTLLRHTVLLKQGAGVGCLRQTENGIMSLELELAAEGRRPDKAGVLAKGSGGDKQYFLTALN